MIIKYHESLLLNRSNLLFDWFTDLGVDLHMIFKTSISHSLSKNISIEPTSLCGIIEVAPHDNFYFYLGNLYFNDHKVRDALETLSKIKNKDYLCWGIMGQCNLELNQVEKAIECLEFATYLNDKDIHGLFLLSKSYMINKENKMGLYTLSKCWSLCPRNPEIAYLYSMASVEVESNDYLYIAKNYILQSLDNDFPELIAGGIMLGIRMKDRDFLDFLIENIKPSDLKSTEFANSLGKILNEINKEEFTEQRLNLLTQLTHPF